MRVKKVAVRTVTATRVTTRCSSTISVSVRRARSVTAVAMSARSVRSSGNVTTWLRERGTHGAALTVVSPPPLASSRIHSPVVGPNVAVSADASVAARSATVEMPMAESFFAVLGPTPHSASTGRSPIMVIQLSSVSAAMPAGLPKPVATLARCLLSLIPTEHVRPVCAAIVCWMRRARSNGSSVGPAPTYASSQPQTSTGWPRSRSACITCSEAAS